MLFRLQCVAHIAAAISVAAFFSVATWMLLRQPHILTHADGVLTRAEAIESKVNATAVNIDKATKAWSDSSKDQAASIQKLAQDAHGTLTAATGTFSALQVTSDKLGVSADALTGEIASVKATTDTLPPMVGDIRADLLKFVPIEDSAHESLADLDALLRRPSLIEGMDSMSNTAKHFDGISGDFQTKFHAVLYPPKCTGNWCWLIKAYPIIKDAGEMAEPAYWGYQLFRGIKP